jgi:hypothetical protein
MANRLDITIENKKANMHTDRCGNTSGQKYHAKGRRKQTKMQGFLYRDTANVEREMYDYTGNNWSHRNINKRSKNSGSHTRETFSRFITLLVT